MPMGQCLSQVRTIRRNSLLPIPTCSRPTPVYFGIPRAQFFQLCSYLRNLGRVVIPKPTSPSISVSDLVRRATAPKPFVDMNFLNASV